MNHRLFLLSVIVIIFAFDIISLNAQKIYTVDVQQVNTTVRRGHLDLGGTNIIGETIDVNNFYIERNGEPVIPVIGEFHYSRYPNQYWDEEIKKIKSGGVTVIATYVFWSLHEPVEGEFNWEGDLNLRRFIELCKNNNIEVIVRVGPFAHGELRNGGIPDWLYGRPFEVRSNDTAYLDYVKSLYNQIGQQTDGLFFSDGGPIIGIQLENEYQHSAAPWAITYEGAEKEFTVARLDRKITQVGVGINKIGNDHSAYGQKHMQTLKKFAKDAGLIAPLYTATGWGYASIVEKGSLPVMSAYAYPFWEEGNTASPFYLFKNMHKNPDYSPVSYTPEDYPSLAAEIGTGMSVTYPRRPRVKGESFLPMMTRMLGSGSNGLGYYMYHGGTTPSKGFFMYSEGSGLNLKSYDYQAPLGEFGVPTQGYYGLKVVNSFLKYYGHLLAPLFPVLPETNAAIIPQDTSTLRYTVRSDGYKGFLFMQNFQDHIEMSDLKDLQVKIQGKNETIVFPETGSFTLKAGASAIFPFNLELDEIQIKTATAQPLCAFENNNTKYHVFYSIDGIIPEFVLGTNQEVKAKGAKVTTRNGKTVVTGTNGSTFEFVTNSVHFLIIPSEKAHNAYTIGKPGNKNLIISNAVVLQNEMAIQLVGTNKDNWRVEIYPTVKSLQSNNATVEAQKSTNKLFSTYSILFDKVIPQIDIIKYDDRHYVLNAKNQDFSIVNDIYVKFDYRGDRGLCMLNGELATDNLYTSKPWQIGLKRYCNLLKTKEMYFLFYPMKKNAPYLGYLDKEVLPDFSEVDEFLDIKQPEIIPEYKVVLSITN